MSEISVAIIIPVKEFNPNLKKCLEECIKLDYPNYEIIVFSDQSKKGFEKFGEKVRVVLSGNIGPALKRDMALEHSEAALFAFLDDDAYPNADWLKLAVKHFEDQEVAAIGGPGLTPKESNFMKKAGGYVFSSYFATGKFSYRYSPGKKVMEVDDLPSCNFIVRRSIFEEIGGFNCEFWPGEDTKLCLEITKNLGKKILYDPTVIVYHHRRALFSSHLKQVSNYALTRGYFVKRLPETSLRPIYFIPSLFVLYLFTGIFTVFLNKNICLIYLATLTAYILLISISTIAMVLKQREELSFVLKVKLISFIIIGIISTHLSYGIFFIKGLLVRKLNIK